MKLSEHAIEEYKLENLKIEDQETAKSIQKCADMFSADIIDDYITDCCEMGETTTALFRESVTPFVAYLRQRLEYALCDFIIEKIDNYEVS